MPSDPSAPPPRPSPKSPDVPSSMEAKDEPDTVTSDPASAPPECSKDTPDKEGDAAPLATEKSTEGNSAANKSTPSSPTLPRRPTDPSKRRRSSGHAKQNSASNISTSTAKNISLSSNAKPISEWSHQQLAPGGVTTEEPEEQEEDEWQEMPAYAPFDIYDDDGKLIARENEEEEGLPGSAPPGYAELGGAAKGYTRVQVDEDAQSATSMDDNTAYLFKERANDVYEDEEARDAIAQMQATKNLLTGNQRIAYVGVVRLAMSEIAKTLQSMERSRGAKKHIDFAIESLRLWSQKMMVRLYGHMELDPAEQLMIEQLAEHGLQPGDLAPTLMQNSTVNNPTLEGTASEAALVAAASSSKAKTDDSKPADSKTTDSKTDDLKIADSKTSASTDSLSKAKDEESKAATSEAINGEQEDAPPPPYKATNDEDGSVPNDVQLPSQLPSTAKIDIDIRWTVLCDLFLILVSDSMYDSRSRDLLEKVGSFLNVSSLDVCRFEKRVTEALEMEEESQKEDWNEAEHMEERKKRARRRRLALMGLATVGGGLVIGLSAGLLAPVIGAGLAAGFTTIGVTGTSGFLAGAGGAAVIGTGGVLTGGTIGVRAANRRTGAVKTFEYRPLHNNKRVNLIVTIAGWMNGKVDDVRLPFSTVDPVMGDIYSVLWEPEMLRSMGDTINILATEALTQGLQQILGSTVLIALMAALQLPIVLSKLSYLIDNPWSNSLAKADMAGLILADSLIDRNLGARPITLVGFSLGSRVIYTCLKELANKGALGLIQNVYLFGTPVVTKKDDYLRARTIVSGRFVNGYAKNDWILAYLFRATSGGIGRVAGLAEVEVPGIENIDVTEHVPGHMAYRQSMPKIMRQVGWQVTSDEFTEIEDPDPDNHEKRQRELINEIEEARKELEGKPEKKRFAFFGKAKKMRQKQAWETYDERMKGGAEEEMNAADGTPGSASGTLFDVEAIRREAAELAVQGIEIKELKSTMPPMKLNSALLAGGATAANGTTLPLRETQSYDGLPSPTASYKNPGSAMSSKSLDRPEIRGRDEEMTGQEDVRMSFEPSNGRSPSLSPRPDFSPSRSPSPSYRNDVQPQSSYQPSTESVEMSFEQPSQSWRSPSPPKRFFNDARGSPSPHRSPTLEPPRQFSRSPSPAKSSFSISRPSNDFNGYSGYSNSQPVQYPSHNTTADISVDRNVWADEDDEDFGREKEMSMTFE